MRQSGIAVYLELGRPFPESWWHPKPMIGKYAQYHHSGEYHDCGTSSITEIEALAKPTLIKTDLADPA